MTKRVVTFGEIMLRLSPPGSERFFQSPELRTFFGGSEANVAVALSHLGDRADFVTRLPENLLGDATIRALRAEGVGTEYIARGGRRLGIYFVEPGIDLREPRVVYDRAGSSFTELEPASLDWDAILDRADWLHLTGITPALGSGPARAAIDAAKVARTHGVRVSVDLNFRHALWTGRDPAPLVRPLVEQADLLIGNAGAAEAMLGIRADAADPGALAGRVQQETGCALAAITRRELLSASEHGWSAALHDARTKATHLSRRWQVRVVDRVGGGDSFAAALIHTLLADRPLADALEFAVAASALKLTIPGDFNRVRAEEVERLVRGG